MPIYPIKKILLLPIILASVFFAFSLFASPAFAAMSFSRVATWSDLGTGDNNTYGIYARGGDFNGDDYEDVVTPIVYIQGLIYIHLGASSFDDIVDITVTKGDAAYAGHIWGDFGFDDIDNDGFDDIVFMSMRADFTRQVTILWGRANPPAALSTNDGSSFVVASSGQSINPVIGDYNGDGNLDIAVVSKSPIDVGEIYIYLGNGTRNIDTTRDALLSLPGSYRPGMIQYGAFEFGDINNDGYDDIYISDAALGSYKNSYLLYGNSNVVDKSYDLKFVGDANADRLTRDSAFGDLNNDGVDDLCMGAYRNSTVASNTGRVYCFWGGSSLLTPAIKDTVETYADFKLPEATDVTAGDNYGRIIEIYDVNNDGYQDLIIGATQESSTLEGYVKIYLGTASGPSTTPVLTINSPEDNYAFGNSIRALDYDADGYLELVVGTIYGGANGGISGKYYLYNLASGSPAITPTAATLTTTDTTPTLTGTATESGVNLAGVQWSTSNTTSGTWSDCTATDGAFDSASESFSCTLPTQSYGTRNIYFRTFDANSIYMPQADYSSVSVTINDFMSETEDEVNLNLAPSGVSDPNNSDTAVLGEKTVTSADEVSVNWDRPADTSNIDEYVVHYREIGSSTWKTETAGPESDSISWDPGEGNWEWYLEIVYTDGSTSETSIYKFEVDQSSPENQIISIADEQMINLADEQGAGLLLPFGSPLIFNFGNTTWDTVIEIWNWDKTIHYTTMVCGSGVCDHGDILTGPLTLVIYTVDEAGNESDRREIKVSPFGVTASLVPATTNTTPAVQGVTTGQAITQPASPISNQIAPGIVRGAVDIDTSLNPAAIKNPGIVNGAVDVAPPAQSPEPPKKLNIIQRIWNSVFH